jgi:hypothetical protein
MLRDNLADSYYRCLENPRPNGADPSLTEDLISPFQAEPTQYCVALPDIENLRIGICPITEFSGGSND